MIVPAVLANSKEDAKRLLDLSQKNFSFVQLDIMDGQLVQSTSVGGEFFKTYPFGKLELEVHLMVKNPLEWIPFFTAKNVKKIIFHIEILRYYPESFVFECIQKIKQMPKRAGLAINPDTELSQLDPFVRHVDSVLFMCVHPGFYGAPFVPEVLKKIQLFKKKYPILHTSVDGGMKLDTIDRVIKTGVNSVCVGSAIFAAPDPKASYLALSKRFAELKKSTRS